MRMYIARKSLRLGQGWAWSGYILISDNVSDVNQSYQSTNQVSKCTNQSETRPSPLNFLYINTS